MNRKGKVIEGDKIYFEHHFPIIVGMNYEGTKKIKGLEKKYGRIIKIDRPSSYINVYTKKEILDETEKRYLKAVIRPFKDKIKFIAKYSTCMGEYISIRLKGDTLVLPYFEPNTMYKGMKKETRYTVKELGLYE